MRNAKTGGRDVKRVLTLAMVAFLVVSSTGFTLALAPLHDPIVVAWDVSMGAQLADHTELEYDLEKDGKFEVRTVNIQTEGIPADIDILVITSKGGDSCLSTIPGYTDPDYIRVRDFVKIEGRRLFLLNDSAPGCVYNTGGMAYNLLGAGPKSWQATWPVTFEAGSHYESDQPSALFNGVDSWQVYHGGSVGEDGASRYEWYAVPPEGDVVTTPPDELDRSYPAMIASQIEEGCAVIVGDSDWIQDAYIDDPDVDNRVLANNVFRYLENCGPWDNPGRLVRGRGTINNYADSYVVVAKYSKDLFEGKLSLETAAGWQFVGDSFDGWLTAGNRASFEGTGKINGGETSYPFKVWAGDGTAGGEDSFRIKIDAPAPYDYDNCPACEDPYNVPINKGRIAIGGKE